MCDLQKDVKQPLKLYENLARSICDSTILTLYSWIHLKCLVDFFTWWSLMPLSALCDCLTDYFLIEIMYWAPWISQVQRFALLSVFLRAQPWDSIYLIGLPYNVTDIQSLHSMVRSFQARSFHLIVRLLHRAIVRTFHKS